MKWEGTNSFLWLSDEGTFVLEPLQFRNSFNILLAAVFKSSGSIEQTMTTEVNNYDICMNAMRSSSMKIRNNVIPRKEPCGKNVFKRNDLDLRPFKLTFITRFVKINMIILISVKRHHKPQTLQDIENDSRSICILKTNFYLLRNLYLHSLFGSKLFPVILY